MTTMNLSIKGVYYCTPNETPASGGKARFSFIFVDKWEVMGYKMRFCSP